jgi:hypothetical protein
MGAIERRGSELGPTAIDDTWSTFRRPLQRGESALLGRFIGPAPRPDPSQRFGEAHPQAFLAGNGPGTRLSTHFHPVCQFQVFVLGSGRMAHHDVRPGSIHYADDNTPYGPIDAGDRGVGFLTLRARTDAGIFEMPTSRDHLKASLATRPTGRQRRNWSADLDDASHPPGSWRVIFRDDDDMRAAVVSLEAGVGTDAASRGDGSFLVVLAGSIANADDAYRADGHLRWLAAGETLRVVSGPGGVKVLHVQFGRHAA